MDVHVTYLWFSRHKTLFPPYISILAFFGSRKFVSLNINHLVSSDQVGNLIDMYIVLSIFSEMDRIFCISDLCLSEQMVQKIHRIPFILNRCALLTADSSFHRFSPGYHRKTISSRMDNKTLPSQYSYPRRPQRHFNYHTTIFACIPITILLYPSSSQDRWF